MKPIISYFFPDRNRKTNKSSFAHKNIRPPWRAGRERIKSRKAVPCSFRFAFCSCSADFDSAGSAGSCSHSFGSWPGSFGFWNS
jgi:hypothetical protein